MLSQDQEDTNVSRSKVFHDIIYTLKRIEQLNSMFYNDSFKQPIADKDERVIADEDMLAKIFVVSVKRLYGQRFNITRQEVEDLLNILDKSVFFNSILQRKAHKTYSEVIGCLRELQ